MMKQFIEEISAIGLRKSSSHNTESASRGAQELDPCDPPGDNRQIMAG